MAVAQAQLQGLDHLHRDLFNRVECILLAEPEPLGPETDLI
jgi:hypothetical protein